MTPDDVPPTPGPRRETLLGRTIRRRWAQGAALGILIAAGLGALIVATVRPTYRSTAWLRVEPRPRLPILAPTSEDHEFGPFMQTQVALIASPDVLSEALQDRIVKDLPRARQSLDPEADLRKAIEVEAQQGTSLILISMEDQKADEAAALVNAVVRAYMSVAQTWTTTEGQAQIAKLRDTHKKFEGDVAEKQKTLLNLLKGHGYRQVIDASELAGDPGPRLRERLLDADLDELAARARLEALKHHADGDEARTRRHAERIEDLEIEAEAAKGLRKSLADRLAGIEIKESSSEAVNIEFARADLNFARKQQEGITSALQQAEYEAQAGSRISLISLAKPSNTPDHDRRLVLIPAATVAAFALSFLLMLVLEARAGRPGAMRAADAGSLGP